MKKLPLIGIFTILSFTGFSQETAAPAADTKKGNTFELQAKGTVNSTWLFNKNISDIGDAQNYSAGWGYNYGLAFNAYFGNVGFGIEALIDDHKGAYSGTLTSTDSSGTSTSTPYKSYINLKTIQIPVLFKLKTKSGAYLEIGPQFNLLTSANYHYAADQATVDTLVTSAYSNSYFSAVLGFGWKIKFSKTSPLSMLIGARFQYSFTDLKGVDGLGVALNNPFYYKTSASTSSATGGVMIGLTYKLGK